MAKKNVQVVKSAPTTEQTAATITALATIEGSNAVTLKNSFISAGAPAEDLSGFVQKTAAIIKPREMPDGSSIRAFIVEAVPSTHREFKKPLLKLRNKGGMVALFPITAVIQRALAQDSMEVKGDDKQNDAIIAAVNAQAGAEIIIIKTGTKQNEKGKKPTHLFDVLVKPAN